MAIITTTGIAVNTRSRAGRRVQDEMLKALGGAQKSGVKDPVKLREVVLVARDVEVARAKGITLDEVPVKADDAVKADAELAVAEAVAVADDDRRR